MKQFALIERKPTIEEFLRLRKSAAWPLLDAPSIGAGLDSSSYGVCAVIDDNVVGMARIVGDGSTCFYVQDVIVMPECQGMGIGTAMMEKTMKYVEKKACHGAVVGLMSVKGKEEFYERFGFWKRPVGNFGHGMVQFWGEKTE